MRYFARTPQPGVAPVLPTTGEPTPCCRTCHRDLGSLEPGFAAAHRSPDCPECERPLEISHASDVTTLIELGDRLDAIAVSEQIKTVHVPGIEPPPRPVAGTQPVVTSKRAKRTS